jgi:VWFA-related protein
MLRCPAAALIVAGVLGAALPVQRSKPDASSRDLVELDVVVLDRQGFSVSGLAQEDFRIAEDGHVVDVKTFASVTALGSTRDDDARVVTLLMDDVGVPITGTSAMQAIARVLMAPTGQGDEISVVRLSSRSDEAFGDSGTARDRIGGYRGGIVPFSRRDTPETVLKAVARISGQLQPVEHRRKIVLCLGLPSVCDVEEPSPAGTNVLWPSWFEAMSAAARANVSVYSVDPTGLNAGSGARATGLVGLTGGQRFRNSNDFQHAARSIWQDAGHYYLLGYWPAASTRDLHTIDVKVARQGVRVLARQRR